MYTNGCTKTFIPPTKHAEQKWIECWMLYYYCCYTLLGRLYFFHIGSLHCSLNECFNFNRIDGIKCYISVFINCMYSPKISQNYEKLHSVRFNGHKSLLAKKSSKCIEIVLSLWSFMIICRSNFIESVIYKSHSILVAIFCSSQWWSSTTTAILVI